MPAVTLAPTPTVAATVSGHSLLLYRVQDAPLAALRDLAYLDGPTRPGTKYATSAPASKFPGPNPVSLDTSHFPTLAAEPYYACEKTDGVRMLLVCCRHAGVNLVALVDRAMTWYLFPLQLVPKAMYQGTLLDGELAWNKATKAWEYLVFDAVTVSAIPVTSCTLPQRLAAVHRALQGKYKPVAQDPALLRIKTFVPCSKPDDVSSHLCRAKLTYDVDGLILTPARAPVVYGRHNGMFKLKFGSRHTVDFLVAPNGKDLLVFDAGQHTAVGRLSGCAYLKPGCIAECVPHSTADFAEWDVVTVRTDKTTANDMFTYRKTLLNMREKLDWDKVKRVFVH